MSNSSARKPGLVDWAGLLVVRIGVAFYRLMIQPPIPSGACRFHPTCSQYMLDAVVKYGFFNGLSRGLGRLLRCRPGCTGGHDPA